MPDNDSDNVFQIGAELMEAREARQNAADAAHRIQHLMETGEAAHAWVHENDHLIPEEYRWFIVESVCHSVAGLALAGIVTDLVGEVAGAVEETAEERARRAGIDPGAHPSRLGDDVSE